MRVAAPTRSSHLSSDVHTTSPKFVMVSTLRLNVSLTLHENILLRYFCGDGTKAKVDDADSKVDEIIMTGTEYLLSKAREV